jgi:hypothetical protein
MGDSEVGFDEVVAALDALCAPRLTDYEGFLRAYVELVKDEGIVGGWLVRQRGG